MNTMNTSIISAGQSLTANRFRLIYLLCTLLVLGACSAETATETDADEPAAAEQDNGHADENLTTLTTAQFKAAGITVGGITVRNLSNTLRVNGSVDVPPQNLINISAPMGGFIRKTELLPGMAIKKGQLLAVLEHPDYVTLQQEYVESSNELAYMEQEYRRQQTLSSENVSALKTFQQTEAAYKNLQARVKALEEKLAIIGVKATGLTAANISRYVNLYAPVSGYVSAVDVNLGKYVTPTDVLFRLIDAEHLHADLTVYEKDLGKIRAGQRVWFTAPNAPSKTHQAEVYLIGKQIEDDRSIRVHAHLEEEGDDLVPGMYVQAVIETGANPVPAVPDEALVQFEGNHYVYIVRGTPAGDAADYTFEMTEVQTGVSENGFTEVVLPDSINAATATVVTKGAFTLLGKMKNSEEAGHAH